MLMTTDQVRAAASYVAREWGEEGYRMEPAGLVLDGGFVVWDVLCMIDGAEFRVASDRWGNVRDVSPDRHGSPAVLV
jgi:hypothetical protein